MKKYIRIIVIFLSIHLFGCASIASEKDTRSARSTFFNDAEGNYKIAYNILSSWDWPGQDRIDIAVSNFDGSNKQNISEALYPKEIVYSVFPNWSPDGKWLVFTLVKHLEELSDVKVEVDVEIYVADQDILYPQKVYSYKYTRANEISDYMYSFGKVLWSKDSKKILVFQVNNPTPILVSLEPSASFQKFPENDYNEFVQKNKDQMLIPPDGISPDGKHELIRTFQKEISFGPKGFDIPDIGDFLSFQIQGDAMYLKNRGSSTKKKILNYHANFMWTKDSKYIILFSLYTERFYIVNLKGKSVRIEGVNPDVQFAYY